jgi:hypothetical protein
MTKATIRPVDGETFTLLVGGERRRYANDRAGRRQAILDGLETIETVAVGQDVYLPSNAALQAVAAVLYPDGIQTEEAYRLVGQVTERACTYLGYGSEEELGPPHVPFAARGAYRKRYPPVDPQLVLDELELAGTGSYYPRLEANWRVLWNKVAREIYGKPWSGLTEAQQAQIQAQVDVIAAGAGWAQADDGADVYTKPLLVNVDAARQRLAQYLQNADGRPVSERRVLAQAQTGAYGRAFYHDELAPEIAAIVTDVLQVHGYQAEPEAGEYRPAPVAVPSEATQSLTAALESLQTVNTDFGPSLLLRDVLAAVRPVLGVETLSDWQVEQLVQKGVLGQALRRLGFQTELTWCRPYHFQPTLGDDQPHQVLLKEVRVRHDPDKTLSLAGGLAVYTPALTIDDEENTLVCLEMVGPKQSVKANWAALVGGGKVHWIGRQRVQLDGMKQHVRVQASLPCGWTSTALIHKQASLKEMNPEEPFYLLDDGTRPIPPLFYAMLNKSLALPLLEEWVDYLWVAGRGERLVQLLDEGHGQGYVAWRVLPARAGWEQLTRDGLSTGQITF